MFAFIIAIVFIGLLLVAYHQTGKMYERDIEKLFRKTQ